MDKQGKLSRIYSSMQEHFDALYAPDKKIFVFGDGSVSASIVLVGEAPGEQETLLGKPFVGKAGKNLDEFLCITGLRRPDLFITNVVKFRPVKLSDKGRASNRPPTREEISLFRPYLLEELSVIAPRLIVTLGNVPLRAMTGENKTVIGAVHGQALDCEAGKIFPLYHPASVIYNRALKDTYLNDLQALKEYLTTHNIAE